MWMRRVVRSGLVILFAFALLVPVSEVCADIVKKGPQAQTPYISTRGHFTDIPLLGPELNPGHSANDFDTTGDVPGLGKGPCPKELVIYIHGFNNNSSDAVKIFNQANNSLKLDPQESPVIGFSWESDQGPLDFDDSSRIATMNGRKLAQFLYEYRCTCPDTRMRLIAHSQGSRLVLNALQTLKEYNHVASIVLDFPGGRSGDLLFPTFEQGRKLRSLINYNCKCFKDVNVESVALVGAAVDNEEVQIGEFGMAISEVVSGKFVNYYNEQDPILKFLFTPEDFDLALGLSGAERGVFLADNYYDVNVTEQVGKDHSGYVGKSSDPEAEGGGDGIMDLVKTNWIGRDSSLVKPNFVYHPTPSQEDKPALMKDVCPPDFIIFDENEDHTLGDSEILEAIEVWIGGGLDDISVIAAIEVWIEQTIFDSILQTPFATFGFDTELPFEVGQSIQFNARNSFDPDGTIESFDWDFGDGTPKAGQTPTHIFASPGDYVISLTVTDSDGFNNVLSVSVNVVEGKTTLDLRLGEDPLGFPGEFVSINGFFEGGTAPFEVRLSYPWGQETWVVFATTFTFQPQIPRATTPGDYPFSITVTDSIGINGNGVGTIRVLEETSIPPFIQDIEFPSAIPGDGQIRDALVAFQDADGDVFQIEYRAVAGPSAGQPAQTFALDVQGRQSGTFAFRLACTNTTGAPFQVTERFTLIDAAGNRSDAFDLTYTCEDTGGGGQPPGIVTLSFPPNPSVGVPAGGEVFFADPDGDIVEFRLEIPRRFALNTSFNPGVQGQTNGSFAFTLTCDAPGIVDANATLHDSQGHVSDRWQFSFSCQSSGGGNTPPAITEISFPSQVLVTQTERGNVFFSDLDGDVVSVTFQSQQLNPQSSTLNLNVQGQTSGSFGFNSGCGCSPIAVTVNVTLTDAQGNFSTPRAFSYQCVVPTGGFGVGNGPLPAP